MANNSTIGRNMATLVSNHAGLRRLRYIGRSRNFRIGLVIGLSALVMLASIGSIVARPSRETERAKVAALAEPDRDKLLRNYDRFIALDKTEQNRLIELHRQLASDPHQAHLRRVMENYYSWLKDLQPGQRADLHKLTGTELVERVAKLRNDQQRQDAAHADRTVLAAWMEQQILLTLPDDERQMIQTKSPIERRWAAMQKVRQQGAASIVQQVTDEALSELKREVSPQLRRELNAAHSRAEIARLLGSKLADLPRQFYMGNVSSLDPETAAQRKERLKEFFEHDLTDLERDGLLSLPPSDMYHQLWRLYLQHKYPQQWSRERSRFEPSWARNRSGRPPTKAGNAEERKKRQKRTPPLTG